ncbi:hypothetical protein L207DRAFT_520102 [Hyaloscypha variabilis F]|uniref:Uncharacterized protein n=1 Tax=Hyaloscypha variabilis (strain UAMH 11265 / GT02V1 / F) TaxID=1149755 RepID=A0A2J6QWH4_HYAVF|nr:hypothetical protein L207DRAFT_520102 [Hyaloscypha variabilis F]
MACLRVCNIGEVFVGASSSASASMMPRREETAARRNHRGLFEKEQEAYMVMDTIEVWGSYQQVL